jgi:hypothetical protein
MQANNDLEQATGEGDIEDARLANGRLVIEREFGPRASRAEGYEYLLTIEYKWDGSKLVRDTTSRRPSKK